jgi:hypothetical protein
VAREVLLRFATRNLDKARKTAKAIQKSVRESAKGVKDVKKRRELLRQAREQAREDRRVINDERKRQRGDIKSRGVRRRARRFGGVNAPSFGDPGEGLVNFAEGKGGLRAVDVSVRAGAAALAAIPILGEFASEAVQLMWEEFGRPYLRRQFELVKEREIGPVLDELQSIRESTLEQRLAAGGEDARNLRQALVDRDQIRNSKRWVKSSRLTDLGG